MYHRGVEYYLMRERLKGEGATLMHMRRAISVEKLNCLRKGNVCHFIKLRMFYIYSKVKGWNLPRQFVLNTSF